MEGECSITATDSRPPGRHPHLLSIRVAPPLPPLPLRAPAPAARPSHCRVDQWNLLAVVTTGSGFCWTHCTGGHTATQGGFILKRASDCHLHPDYVKSCCMMMLVGVFCAGRVWRLCEHLPSLDTRHQSPHQVTSQGSEQWREAQPQYYRRSDILTYSTSPWCSLSIQVKLGKKTMSLGFRLGSRSIPQNNFKRFMHSCIIAYQNDYLHIFWVEEAFNVTIYYLWRNFGRHLEISSFTLVCFLTDSTQ